MISRDVIEILADAMIERGIREHIRSDNGPELTSRHFLAWCIEKKIELVHIQPGKPTQNAHVESFHGRLREECLRISWFQNLFDARRKIAIWRHDYNELTQNPKAVPVETGVILQLRPSGELGGGIDMPKKQHSEPEIISALKQYESGEKTADICRKLGVSQATFYMWKKQYAGLGVQELRELRSLREENGRLKRIVADLTLDRQIL